VLSPCRFVSFAPAEAPPLYLNAVATNAPGKPPKFLSSSSSF
jgi:hypothetical protein